MDNKEKTKVIALSGNNSEYEFTIRNNYEFSFKRQELRIDLVEEADGFLILSYKGLRYPVEIVSRKQNEYEILLNGVSYTFSVETPFSLKRKKLLAANQSAASVEIIKAPMPGKMLDILVSPGQEVNKGESLAVLEAMKMQNTIVAGNKGHVTRVCVKAGQTVSKDEILIEIKL